MLTMIVAMTRNHVIGHQGTMPWHLPRDLKHFKKLTETHTVIMGRKTYESIGKPLVNRRNIVLSQKKNFQGSGIEIFHSLNQALEHCDMEEHCFIIGGGQLYREALQLTQKIYLTLIHTEIAGDTTFPRLGCDWQLSSEEFVSADEKNAFDLSFQCWIRR